MLGYVNPDGQVFSSQVFETEVILVGCHLSKMYFYLLGDNLAFLCVFIRKSFASLGISISIHKYSTQAPWSPLYILIIFDQCYKLAVRQYCGEQCLKLTTLIVS